MATTMIIVFPTLESCVRTVIALNPLIVVKIRNAEVVKLVRHAALKTLWT